MRATTLTHRSLSLALALAVTMAPALACAHGGGERRGPWSVDVVDEHGASLPTFHEGGRTYVLGTLGRRYGIRVRNGSARRVEVVVSVDGRDAIDGRASSLEKRGYVVDPFGEFTVDGYRLGLASVAAFRFSSVPRSYAARMGDARDVGVIGVAVFPEREWPRPRQRRPLPFPVVPDEERSRAEGLEADEGLAGAPSSSEGPRAQGRKSESSAARPGLGTEFGEERDSHATEVPFERARPRPDAVLTLRYDDRAGLLALGIDVDGRRTARADDRWLRERADPFRRDVGFAPPPPGWRR